MFGSDEMVSPTHCFVIQVIFRLRVLVMLVFSVGECDRLVMIFFPTPFIIALLSRR